MQALVYTNTQTLVYREEQNPTEKPGESILKIHASGICGSDMHPSLIMAVVSVHVRTANT
jgi:L-iditol 2-dehydrogenase